MLELKTQIRKTYDNDYSEAIFSDLSEIADVMFQHDNADEFTASGMTDKYIIVFSAKKIGE